MKGDNEYTFVNLLTEKESITIIDNSMTSSNESSKPTLGEKLCTLLESIFVMIGIFFAKRPISSLLIISNLITIIILSNGINLNITSNPIELWSAPGSRARAEKDYFDKHFQPFYRTEQIYIKAVNLPEVRLVICRSNLCWSF